MGSLIELLAGDIQFEAFVFVTAFYDLIIQLHVRWGSERKKISFGKTSREAGENKKLLLLLYLQLKGTVQRTEVETVVKAKELFWGSHKKMEISSIIIIINTVIYIMSGT